LTISRVCVKLKEVREKESNPKLKLLVFPFLKVLPHSLISVGAYLRHFAHALNQNHLQTTNIDINQIQGLEIGKRLTLRLPGQKGATEFHSISVIEGYSKEFNFIYARAAHGKTIGTELQGVPGFGAILIKSSDLKGFEVICH
jgi:hypothetical protein